MSDEKEQKPCECVSGCSCKKSERSPNDGPVYNGFAQQIPTLRTPCPFTEDSERSVCADNLSDSLIRSTKANEKVHVEGSEESVKKKIRMGPSSKIPRSE